MCLRVFKLVSATCLHQTIAYLLTCISTFCQSSLTHLSSFTRNYRCLDVGHAHRAALVHSVWYWVLVNRCCLSQSGSKDLVSLESTRPGKEIKMCVIHVLCTKECRELEMLFSLEWLPSLEPFLIYLPSHVSPCAAFHLLQRTFISLKDINFKWVCSIFNTSI